MGLRDQLVIEEEYFESTKYNINIIIIILLINASWKCLHFPVVYEH